jgi:hypothetical protein
MRPNPLIGLPPPVLEWFNLDLSDGDDNVLIRSVDWRRRSSELSGPVKSYMPRVSQ